MRQRANVMRESGVRPATSSAGTARHGQTDVAAIGSFALSGAPWAQVPSRWQIWPACLQSWPVWLASVMHSPVLLSQAKHGSRVTPLQLLRILW